MSRVAAASPSSVDENLDVEISAEDQANICKFSCLNHRSTELEGDMEALQEELKRLQDAQEEVMICLDEGGIMLKVGESYMACDEASATDFLDRERREKDEKLKLLTNDFNAIKKQMSELEKILYAKFGRRINLEK